MDLKEAILTRRSVRSFLDKPIEGEALDALQTDINLCRKESGLDFMLVLNEPKAFDSFLAHYGKFRNANNYIAIFAKDDPDAETKAGYFGERIVLSAQKMGLNTCWVAVTFRKRMLRKAAARGEKLLLVIAVGYGATQGTPHKSRPAAELFSADDAPDWFLNGVEAARLAPTAMNQQKFLFTLTRNGVRAEAPKGAYTRIDLGIAKLHFELGAGRENFRWVK